MVLFVPVNFHPLNVSIRHEMLFLSWRPILSIPGRVTFSPERAAVTCNYSRVDLLPLKAHSDAINYFIGVTL